MAGTTTTTTTDWSQLVLCPCCKQVAYPPITLSCQHTFCRSCMYEHVHQSLTVPLNDSDHMQVQCPLRCETNFTLSEMHKFQTYMLSALMEQLLPDKVLKRRQTEAQVQHMVEQRLQCMQKSDQVNIPLYYDEDEEDDNDGESEEKRKLLKKLADFCGTQPGPFAVVVLITVLITCLCAATGLSIGEFSTTSDDISFITPILTMYGIMAILLIICMVYAIRLSGWMRHLRHFVYLDQSCEQCYPSRGHCYVPTRARHYAYAAAPVHRRIVHS